MLTAAQGADRPSPIELRSEGSFPVQYIEADNGATHQHKTLALPYLAMIATANLEPNLTSSFFVNAGHDPLGRFRDNDNTFLGAGVNLVKQWGAFAAGTSFERTFYYQGVYDRTAFTANDTTLFARYRWTPDANFRMTPLVNMTVRLDEGFAVQRYSYSARLDIERRLFGSWWLIAMPRIRYSDYVGDQAGRRDTALSLTGGLRYDFNERVSFTTLAGVEDRNSNVSGQSGKKYVVGASIDFNIDFLNPR